MYIHSVSWRWAGGLCGAVGRRRFAVPRHVEGQHAEAPGDLGVGEQMAELAIVGAGGVQADQWYPLTGLLEVEAMGDAVDIGPHVATDHGIELGRHDRSV